MAQHSKIEKYERKPILATMPISFFVIFFSQHNHLSATDKKSNEKFIFYKVIDLYINEDRLMLSIYEIRAIDAK